MFCERNVERACVPLEAGPQQFLKWRCAELASTERQGRLLLPLFRKRKSQNSKKEMRNSNEVQGVETPAPIRGLCCLGFVNPVGVVAGVPRQRLVLSTAPD
jgi:hypothetical protein